MKEKTPPSSTKTRRWDPIPVGIDLTLIEVMRDLDPGWETWRDKGLSRSSRRGQK